MRSSTGIDSLVARAQGGEPGATAELCSDFREAILGFMISALGREDAEEATQHVMLKLLEALPQYHGRDSPFEAWIFAIAHNHAVDYRRRRARVTVTDPIELARMSDDEHPGSGGGSFRSEHSALRELIAPLSPLHRRMLTLLYEHDMSPEQTGRVLGRSAASVRQEHKRAREKLRAIVMRESKRVFQT